MSICKKKYLLIFFSGISILNCHSQISFHSDLQYTKFEPSNISPEIHNIRFPWIKNEGQKQKDVSFYASTFAGTVFITNEGNLLYSLPVDTNTAYSIMESFVGGEINSINGITPSQIEVNYFLGDNKDHWLNKIPTYEGAKLEEIWCGIDLELFARGNNIEKVFRIKPGANTKEIKVKIIGANDLRICKNGELLIKTIAGELKFSKPVAYQLIEGAKKNIDVDYYIRDRMYGFKTGEYHRDYPLIIDPLISSTFLGGAQTDMVVAIALDKSGNVFITGRTKSDDYPVCCEPFDPSYNEGNDDVFVSKLSSDLDSLLASTYIGGNSFDFPYSISIDNSGNIFVSGDTDSNNFPTTDFAFDKTDNNSDAFISKFSNDLSVLLASTFLGGASSENWAHMTLDNEGNVFITGYTKSSDFPMTAAVFDSTKNDGEDIFISKMSSDLDSLLASTYLGGNGNDEPYSISISESGEIHIIGTTYSVDYPMTDFSYKDTLDGSVDVVVSKLNNDLSLLLGSTYMGGNDEDYGYCIALDTSKNVIILGSTNSIDYPVYGNPIDDILDGSSDIFVTKLNDNLSEIVASTFLGGESTERPEFLVTDNSGNIYLTGSTYSSDFPITSSAYDNSLNGGRDAILTVLDNDLENLLYSTFLGGSEHEAGNSIFIDPDGVVYLGGSTNSEDFPVTGSPFVDTLNSGSFDCFVSKFEITLPSIIINNLNNIKDLLIYPNPFSSSTYINFSNPASESFKLTIYNLSGQSMMVIEDIRDSHFEFQRNNLAPGLYLLELKGPKIYRGKILIE